MADSIPYSFKPGIHSHNAFRMAPDGAAAARNPFAGLRTVFLLIGLACVGYFVYTYANQTIYQAYQNWALDRAIAKQKPGQAAQPIIAPAEGSVIGRVSIGRLDLSAVVRQGVGEDTLKEAVGHVPSSALAGQPGNFAIAAHRDTLFRGLKDIKIGDAITFESPAGRFHYEVAATRIVKPSDVSVLRPDGGGLIHRQAGSAPPKLLTMITCYPFYYVGSAPERFIVQAKLVDNSNHAQTPMLN
jgi:sortase A